ncbi:hypothetical protein QQF64_002627 [Cirrhinus molitorella]|uniref:Uncharacterized protein n=1 Tax=Cirrhinus molitorella TaxID=172907 RepID=A0ABR3MQP1_9TELE
MADRICGVWQVTQALALHLTLLMHQHRRPGDLQASHPCTDELSVYSSDNVAECGCSTHFMRKLLRLERAGPRNRRIDVRTPEFKAEYGSIKQNHVRIAINVSLVSTIILETQ